MHLDVFAGRSARGTAGGTEAVTVEAGGVRFIVGAGALTEDTAVRVQAAFCRRSLPIGDGVKAVAEAVVGLAGKTRGHELSVATTAGANPGGRGPRRARRAGGRRAGDGRRFGGGSDRWTDRHARDGGPAGRDAWRPLRVLSRDRAGRMRDRRRAIAGGADGGRRAGIGPAVRVRRHQWPLHDARTRRRRHRLRARHEASLAGRARS